MRRADQPSRPEQCIFLRRLLRENVEGGTGDMTAFKPFLEGGFVDQSAARAIDDADARPGLRQRLTA